MSDKNPDERREKKPKKRFSSKENKAEHQTENNVTPEGEAESGPSRQKPDFMGIFEKWPFPGNGGGQAVAQHPNLALFTLDVVYRNLYLLGIALLRRMRRHRKKAQRILVRIGLAVLALLGVLWALFQKLALRFREYLRRPLDRINNVRAQMHPLIETAKAEGKVPYYAYLRIIGAVGRLVFSVIATIANHVLPVAAAWLLVHTINIYVNQPLALAVIYQGETIGYIQTEQEFDQAVEILKDRFTEDSSSIVDVPDFVLVSAMSEDEQHPVQWLANLVFRMDTADEAFTTVDELADRLMEASGSEIEMAYGLYIDNQFFGAVTDRDYIWEQLQGILDQNTLGYEEETVVFLKSIAVSDGLYPVDSIVDLERMHEAIHQYESVDQVYVVEYGDSPLGIADKNGVPYALIEELNPDLDELYVGQEITIAKARPFLSVQNIYTTVDLEELEYETETQEDAEEEEGFQETIQEGETGEQQITTQITLIDGVVIDREIVDTEVLKEPVPEIIVIGTKSPQTALSTADPGGYTSGGGGGTTASPGGGSSNAPSSYGFIWPTVGGYATTYAGHAGNAIDIARPHGTPIYASAAGTVVAVRSSYSGYGQHIIIDHGNGYQTLYAHASAMFVTPGQQVSQGQHIANVGRTGFSTGNHVHFEIIYNGRYLWPADIVGYSG